MNEITWRNCTYGEQEKQARIVRTVYETFALSIYDQPDLIEEMFIKFEGIYIPLAQTLTQMDRVVALWMDDDIGFKTGTIVLPDHLRKYIFRLQKRVALIAHERSMPFLIHSCGNLEAVMGDLIEGALVASTRSRMSSSRWSPSRYVMVIVLRSLAESMLIYWGGGWKNKCVPERGRYWRLALPAEHMNWEGAVALQFPYN